MLNLGIEFGADQHHNCGKPHPHHQAHHGAERPVGRVVVGEIAEVPYPPGKGRLAGGRDL
jgi:hypothetical protein